MDLLPRSKSTLGLNYKVVDRLMLYKSNGWIVKSLLGLRGSGQEEAAVFGFYLDDGGVIRHETLGEGGGGDEFRCGVVGSSKKCME